MKMAKDNEADLDAALKLCRALESLERRDMPTLDENTEDEYSEPFDEEDREDCKKAIAIVLELFGRASLFRVVFGMAVILDPINKIVDPNSDVLEIHPDIRRGQEDGVRYRWLRARDIDAIDLGGLFVGRTPDNVVMNGDDLDAAIDAAIAEIQEGAES